MNTNLNRKPILVSGSHRSGSTWLGRMIDLSDDVGYIHEPFHKVHGISEDLFSRWFFYICKENEDLFKREIENYLNFKYPLLDKIKNAESFRDYGRAARDFSIFTWHHLNRRRPLMKDPISIYSAEWLYYTFDMDMIILVRHPAAFVGSIKKVEWRTGMHNYLDQPLLMRDHLQDFEPEIREHSAKKKDFVDEAILHWNMIHSVILKYQEKHKNWFFVRHEDLSKKPLMKFEEIYRFLNLDYTDAIKKKITSYTTETESPGKLKRNSKSNVWSWKNRLTEVEIQRVREGTQSISSHFYSSEDW